MYVKTYYEHIDLALRPLTLSRMEPALRQLAEEEWESPEVGTELMNLANDIASRLGRIEKGDLQA
jgi:hypothetical protein